MEKLQALRTEYGKPMTVTSGYRHPTHPIEARKASPGAHASGRAADIAVQGGDALKLIELALKHGFTGIGVNQKGDGRFIHLDDLKHEPGRPRPWVWSY
ncbi:peptidase M15A [Alcanivorax sp. HI0033]|nr:peptidase M15A [Alcanivorax sp. HI0003]KZX65748.1 peptidase M15A [Alcanivorax sp. HI0007]KZX78135.1 peptidase M15A [Alcanivorax sp. HI0013]KZX80817.1 peptidase M15A [Alcanivorax sp. HI0011]KZY09393.1 peptidase M15A [Alcanivorax sp. HI0033]KZY12280.1 peptidase M15A [Alcanivorax sp. HI0035]